VGLRNWINLNVPTGPLTREVLDASLGAMKEVGAVPRHDCHLDGHVAHFASRHCVYCRAKIRELTPDEIRILRAP